MKAYKGFNKDMTCRGFQYEEGKTYETDTADLCNAGFHACENPLDMYRYYAPGQGVFHEVELEDVSDQRDGEDSKVCGKKITIGAKLDVAKICSLHFEYVKSKTTHEVKAGDGKSASAGASGSASAGWRGSASAGEYGSASAGASGSASAGWRGSASAGASGSASAGWRGSASAGEYGSASAGASGSASAGASGSASAGASGSASAGWRGSASAGEYGSASAGASGSASAGASGKAVSGGSASVGVYGVAVCKGNGCKVKGGIGALLIIAEENKYNYEIASWKAAIVDGEKVKADTWYELRDGEFVEFSVHE